MDRSYAFLDVPDGTLCSVYVHTGTRVNELDPGVGEFCGKGCNSPFIVCVQYRCTDSTARVEGEVSAQGFSHRGHVPGVDVGGKQVLERLCDSEDKAESVGHKYVTVKLLWGGVSCEFLMAGERGGRASDCPSLERIRVRSVDGGRSSYVGARHVTVSDVTMRRGLGEFVVGWVGEAFL